MVRTIIVNSFLVTVIMTSVRLPKASSVSKMKSWPRAPVSAYMMSGRRSEGCVERKASVVWTSAVAEGEGWRTGMLVERARGPRESGSQSAGERVRGAPRERKENERERDKKRERRHEEHHLLAFEANRGLAVSIRMCSSTSQICLPTGDPVFSEDLVLARVGCPIDEEVDHEESEADEALAGLLLLNSSLLTGVLRWRALGAEKHKQRDTESDERDD